MRLKLPVLRSLSPLGALAKWGGAGGPILLTLLLLLISLLLLSSWQSTGACDEWCQLDLLNKQIQSYRAKISELQGKARTLANQISSMDYQIRLTELEIKERETEIELLGKDIGDLTQRLERLGAFLEHEERIFVARARSAYIAEHLSPFDIILGSEGLDEAIRQIKYLKVFETQDREVLEQMRDTRNEYSEQKSLLENKKIDVEALKGELDSKRVLLVQQKQSKEHLLAVTRNDEGVYQRLLQQALAEEAAIRALITARGGVTCLSSQTYCDGWGCYYNQRDIAWCKSSLGYSGLPVGGYGCTVSSVAMVASHYGHNITPGDIAATPSAFFPGTAYLNCTITVKGVTIVRGCWGSPGIIDGELAAGRPVIVGVNPYYGPTPSHYIVLKSGSGGNYIMNDPWYAGGRDIPFSKYYKVGMIKTANNVVVY